MNSKPELKIEFNKSAFATKSEVKEFEKPELKRFNMKFSQLDLKIIDAVAKRDGTSRSQIINVLIDKMVKDFVMSLDRDMGEETALIVTILTERSYEPKTKSDKDFSWDVWYIVEKSNATNLALEKLDGLINDLNLKFYNQDQQLSYQNKKICEKILNYRPQVHDAILKFPNPNYQKNI